MSSTPFQIGHAVDNYKADAPAYGFTDPYNTTEFDDQLIKRGIVTYEQAIIAKGATPEDARRLHLLKEEMERPAAAIMDDSRPPLSKENDDDDDDESYEDSFEDDDDFLLQYRSKRIHELREEQNSDPYGKVINISRSEWKKEVNEASCIDNNFVIVHLQYPYGQEVDDSIHYLASKYPTVKFVSIDYQEAVTNNYPTENLPTIFAYQNGKLAFQDINFNPERNNIELTLGKWGVIQVEGLEENDEEYDPSYKSRNSLFGGMTTRFATKNSTEYDDDDL